MKVAVNMRLPNGAYTKAKEDHPTWEVIAVSAAGGRT